MKKCPKCGKTYENAPTLCPADGTVLVKTGDALVGQTLAGKYRIEERISEGGMGTVYRATHILMEKAVAIKVLHPSLAADDKIVARFTREAKAASRISNPHALNVTDFGESENGIVFLVMEYLRGKTLKEVIRGEGPMPLERVVEVTRQICGALDAAHAEGVVHRDLKSDNIMLEEVAGGNDWAKVLDFGIAKILETEGPDPELTAPNLIIGTPQYMSPEQCSQASGIDARSDIYSLGIILYEMLVGHVPFTGESATAIMLKHLQEPPPSVLEERKDLPPSVGQVIARALSKLPEERQESAGALAEALASAAADMSGMKVGSVTSENAQLGASNTNRIVVPTAPLESRHTESNEQDEATVVHRREQSYVEDEPELFEMPPPVASFNPWRIMIPAAVLLVALLGAFFAFQRNPGSSGTNDNSQPLVVDPNASPVQPGATPTGAGESNIVPTVGTTPPPSTPAQTSTGTGGTTVNPNPETTPTPTPAEDDPQNSNTPEEEEEEPEPTPSATPRRNPTPPPVRTPTPNDDPPPPSPRATPPPKLDNPAEDPPPGRDLL